MKNFGKSQALHAGFAKAKVKSSQWMLIYKIVLKTRLIQYDYLQNFDLVSGWKKSATIQWLLKPTFKIIQLGG
jgi:hypothetical protein